MSVLYLDGFFHATPPHRICFLGILLQVESVGIALNIADKLPYYIEAVWAYFNRLEKCVADSPPAEGDLEPGGVHGGGEPLMYLMGPAAEEKPKPLHVVCAHGLYDGIVVVLEFVVFGFVVWVGSGVVGVVAVAGVGRTVAGVGRTVGVIHFGMECLAEVSGVL